MRSIGMAVLMSFLFILSSCKHEIKSYEHELGVISNPRMYHQLAKDFPQKQLIDLEEVIPGAIIDIRYATKNNFTHKKIYPEAKAYLREPAAKALKNVQEALNKTGLGLKVFDAYRPYSATLKFYEIYPDTNFVAAPWHGSRHNRGCAVDVTLVDLKTGEELPMPTPFDDFTEKAGYDYTDLPDTVIKNREILREYMNRFGFDHYKYEWWHFDYHDWKHFELLNIPFDELGG